MTSARPAPGETDDNTRSVIEAELDRNLYVEAGAGTGKTSSLVNRLSALLASGKARPENIAAITFTRAAAFELRSRTREKLEGRARDPGVSDGERKRLSAAVDGLDLASIQTINAFALSLLQERPLDIGLPPVLSPMNEIEAGIDFDARWDERVRATLEDDIEFVKAVGLARRFGLANPLDSLRRIARDFADRYHLLDTAVDTQKTPVDEEPLPLSTGVLTDALTDALALAAVCKDPDDLLYRHVHDNVAPAVRRLTAQFEADGRVPAEYLHGLPSLKSNRGKKGNWPDPDALARLRELLADLQASVDRCVDARKRQVADILLRAPANFAVEYAVERKQSGRPTFHDQLVWSRDLLRNAPEARSHFQARFTHILVDEFQDTDPLQIELLDLLVRDPDSNKARNGAVFLVGDPKQSVYRFRGADPGAAQRFQELVAGGRSLLFLKQNHRSDNAVLRWVNNVFEKWMSEGHDDGQAGYVELEPDAKQQGEGAVWWMGGALDDVGASAARLIEFEHVAGVAAEVCNGKLRVRDSDGHIRPSRASDMAVLFRRRTDIEALEDALNRRNVPYTFEGQGPVFASQELRDLRNCLNAVDDPADEVAVVAALRSPAFSCSDPDLWRWRQSGGKFDYLSDTSSGAEGPVKDALQTLEKFHRESRGTPVTRLVENFIRDRRLREKALFLHHGEVRARRLDLVVDLAASVAADPLVSLRHFVAWLERQAQDNTQLPESVSQSASSGAVRLMTIHQSKGLEFPVVLMASLGASQNTGALVRVRRGARGPEGLEARLGSAGLGLETPGYVAAIESDRAGDELEAARLMYVAATRARDHLIVSLYRSGKGKSAQHGTQAKIEQFAREQAALWDEVTFTPAATFEAGKEAAYRPDSHEDRERWRQERTEAVRRAAAPTYTTPSALKSGRADNAPLAKIESSDSESEPGRSGRGAREKGRAVHAVLQRCDLSAEAQQDLAPLAEKAADEHGVMAEKDDIEQLARAVLGSEVMQRARVADRAGRAWREVWVAAPLAPFDEDARGANGDEHSGDLEGQIDLIFEDSDGGLVIVDYKTDTIAGGGESAAAEPYLPQLGAYAWAVEQSTGRTVKEAWLVFARLAGSGTSGQFAVPDLRAEMEGSRRLALEQLTMAATAE